MRCTVHELLERHEHQQALERQFGVALLHRTTRQVTLTPVGEVVLVGARDLIADAERLVAAARSHARREAGALSVGCLGVIPGQLLPRIVERLKVEWPEVHLDVRSYDFAAIVDGLLAAEVDVAFGHIPPGADSIELLTPADTGDIEVVPLADEPRVVILPRDHRLAGRASLSPADLSGETFISQSSVLAESWRDFWLLTDQLGARPTLSTRPTDDIADLLLQIAHHRGIDTAPATTAPYYPWPNLAYVPLTDAPPARLVLLRHRDANAPQIAAFTELAVELARSAPELSTGG